MIVDWSIDKFQAWLVIQGLRKNLGIDYFDTYAPVVRIYMNLVIRQMDVKTAF